MPREEILAQITAIGTCESEAERRDMLAGLSDEVTAAFDSIDTLTQTNASLTNDNESLRSANMRLFLRLGEQKDDKERFKDETGLDDKKQEKRKFEDLFNEKGGLK